MSDIQILLVDDEPGIRDTYSRILKRSGYTVQTASNGEEALAKLAKSTIELMITDILMPGMDGLELVRRVKDYDDNVKVIIMTAHASVDSAVEAIKLGAFGYLRKPFTRVDLMDSLSRALTVRRAELSLAGLPSPEGECDFRGIIGQSEAIKRVFRMVTKVAPGDATILLTGESGTGKELFARAIHANSERYKERFVSINCGALPETLLESELFGHVRGSFTGAVKDKEGLLVYADGGTFFMDEVAEMAHATQVKLLRVLEEREVVPVGDTKPKKVNVRIIAATNVDLREKVENREFRPDLFYRLNVIPIEIPPLRSRKEDIPILVAHFIQKYVKSGNLPMRDFSHEAMRIMKGYNWPGNVRELENLVQRCLTLAENDSISADELPELFMHSGETSSSSVEVGEEISLHELERRHIMSILEKTGWHKKKTAQILGIDPSTLYRKLERLGLSGSENEPI